MTTTQHDSKLVEAVAAWLQNGRWIAGHRVMYPVEGGDNVARTLASSLLDVIDAARLGQPDGDK